jgi:hypothetical protein
MATAAETIEAGSHFKRVLRVRCHVAIGADPLGKWEVKSSAEETCFGRGVRIVTDGALGLDYWMTLVGGLKPGVVLVAHHAIATTLPVGKVSEGRGVWLVAGGALVATERGMQQGTGLPVRYVCMTRRAELRARRYQQMVIGAAVRRVALDAAALLRWRVHHLERQLFREIPVTLHAERPRAFAQQPREPRDMGAVAGRAVPVRRGHVRHPRGQLRLEIVTGEADLLLVDLLDGAGNADYAQRQEKAPHHSPRQTTPVHGCPPAVSW